METLLTYLLKVSVSLAMFYALHMLLLRKETFLRLRRSYFGLALIFSLLYPFINLNWTVAERTELPLPAYLLSEIVIVAQPNANEVADISSSAFTSVHILIALLVLGSTFLLLRFVMQLISLFFQLRKAKTSRLGQHKLVMLEDDSTASYSFFHWIVINTSNASKNQIDDIVRHEKAHSSQWHSVDVVAYEVICILFWWNPFVWLLKNEMKLNLEYLADQEVQKHKEDTREYQYTLLQISIANTGVAFINNFNISQLKKRITMMNKKRTSKIWSSKFLLVLPLALALILGNVQCTDAGKSVPEDNKVPVKTNATKIPETDDILSMDVAEDGVTIITKTDTLKFTREEFAKLLGKTELEKEQKRASNMKSKKEGVFTIVEDMPKFPGGEQEMMKFIGSNLKYPVVAQEAGIQGRVVIRFIVSTEGDIEDVEVVRGIDPSCDREAMRVVKSMPKWTPGKQNGKAVPVYFTLPILFRLK